MMPWRASIDAWTRDCSTSYGARRQSKPIESLRRRNVVCWGSANLAAARKVVGAEEVSRGDMPRLMLGSDAGARGSDARPRRSDADLSLDFENRPQLFRHPLDLTLCQLREEGERDRPCGDVLANRELTLAVAEPLAVERHQVDCREVRLARYTSLAQRPHDLIALDAARQLDDEYEPAAAGAAGVGAR